MVRVHVLNVGKGSSTWIEFPERLSVIDIDDSTAKDDATLTDPLEYYRTNFPDREIFRFILTHPDMDHMSGLDELARTTSIANFWDTHNDKRITEWHGPYRREDWQRYQAFRSSQSSPKCLRLHRNETSECCWTQDGLSILSPTPELDAQANKTEDYNHISYVLRQEYAGTVVIHGGDASKTAWDSIYEATPDALLKAQILVAPHHGSDTCVHEEALRAVDPDWVIVSVAADADFDEDFYAGIAGQGVLTTRANGNMVVELRDNGTYQITVDHL